MNTQAERIKQLSATKRALLEKLLASQSDAPGTSAANGVRLVARGAGEAPLSFAQQRLWFLEQLEPGNPAYHISSALRLSGPWDVDLLEQALAGVVARHEALRTRLFAVDGEPRQQIDAESAWSLERIELRHLDPPARSAEVRRLARREARRPFDLASGPLMRAVLAQLDEELYALVLVLHHIAGDGWSMMVLKHEVAALYEAFATGRTSPLAPLPLQYADYAVWQREWLDSGALAPQLDYWRTQLGDAPPVLDLPVDRPRPAAQTYNGASVRTWLGPETRTAITQLASDNECTPFMVLLAGFAAVLSRLSGQADFCIGSPIANRKNVELERLIGLFVNTLVLRIDTAGDPSFGELLGRVRRLTLDAYAHQDVPFEQLVDALGLRRDAGRSPLFDVMFVMQNIPERAIEHDTLAVSDVELGLGEAASFDLTLNVQLQRDGWELLLVYNTDLFDEATAKRWLDGLELVLSAVAHSGEKPISQLAIQSAPACQQLIAEFNQTQAPYPDDCCLYDLFHEQACRAADAPAVKELNAAHHAAGDSSQQDPIRVSRQISFGELDAQARQLALHLRRQGVGPDTVVGLCAEPSIEQMVGLVGILAAGGCYLPLDPDYPPARLAYMIADAGPQLILATSTAAEKLPSGTFEIVDLTRSTASASEVQHDSEPSTNCNGGQEELARNGLTPDHLAYLVYTSGSTGEPKGVEVPHRGVVNHATALIERLGMDVGDRMLRLLSLAFDGSGEEIFPSLLSGATQIIHPDVRQLLPREYAQLAQTAGVTLVHIPPPLLDQMFDDVAESRVPPPAFKAVLTGGGSVNADKLDAFMQATGGHVKFVSAYGISEATITTTLFEYGHGIQRSGRGMLPIGKPIKNNEIYVLDEHLAPSPIGVAGEIYIAGVGLARGYLGQDDLTRERYLPHPFSDTPGARMYRTGDIGRVLADGSLEFLRRKDQQVKIRNVRIELGEIESLLDEHPSIAASAAVAYGEDGNRRLVAYFEPLDNADPEAETLRSYLADRLTEQAIPAAYVKLDALPRTSTGKIDRPALPDPPAANLARKVPYAAPRNDLERTLAEVWSTVLAVDSVGIHDNFFDLGGDSIQSLQMVARAADAGIHITPKHLFLHQTVGELAQVAEGQSRIDAEQGPVTGDVPLVPVQQTFFDSFRNHPAALAQTALFDLSPRLTLEHLQLAIDVVVEHHDALRARFVPTDQSVRQTIDPPADCAIAQFDLAGTMPAQLPSAIRRAAGQLVDEIDIEAGPLYRFAVVETGGRRHLLAAIHHLVIDGVSWRVLLEDLNLAALQASRGLTPALAAKSTSLKAWAERLADYATSDDVAQESSYWVAETALARDAATLPLDHPTGENGVSSEAHLDVALDAERTQRLLEEAGATYRTRLDELLLAALVGLLAKEGKHGATTPDVVRIELEGHGREDRFDDIDLSRTVGWLTTIYPVSLRGGKASVGQRIKGVKEQLRAVPGGLAYGLARWRGEASRRDALARVAAPQVRFNYLGRLDSLVPADAMIVPVPEPLEAEFGDRHAPADDARRSLWEVNTYVRGGQLHVRWTYSTALHEQSTIQRVADDYLAQINEVIDHCLEPDAGELTPSDFPLANLDEDDLAQLSLLLGGDGEE